MLSERDDPKSLLAPEPAWDSTMRDAAPEMLVPEAILRVIEGPSRGAELRVGGGRVTVGRDPHNDLALADPRVSAIHLEITTGPQGHLLRDMGSTNGTFLGHSRVTESWLGPGARVIVGGSTLELSPLGTKVSVTLSNAPIFGTLVGSSPEMRRLFAILERVAPTDLTTVIEGETGTGKEEVARALHAGSRRREGPFVVLDCGAIPRSLAEGTIFGWERGAFTGADRRQLGSFESANHGTLLLDEVGELPAELQPKLLRVLETRAVTRLGDHTPHPVDVRVVAATNKDLRRMVNDGRFRSDLFYRLAEVQIPLPPLRARPGDVAVLIDHFLLRVAERSGLPPARLTPSASERLARHEWSGNVRELKNFAERVGMLLAGQFLDADAVARELRLAAPRAGTMSVDSRLPYKDAKDEVLRQFEAHYLAELWSRCQGNLSAAAREAGMARQNLRALLRKAGLRDD
jgi:DNA-binding NtrC family response regulator